MCEYLERSDAKISSLVFDGLMVYKKDVEGRHEEPLEGCMTKVKKVVGVDLRILEKPMDKQFNINLGRKELKENE